LRTRLKPEPRGLLAAIAPCVLASRVEHLFHVVKRIISFANVRDRGIVQNAHRLAVNFALGDLYSHRRRLLASGSRRLSLPVSL